LDLAASSARTASTEPQARWGAGPKK